MKPRSSLRRSAVVAALVTAVLATAAAPPRPATTAPQAGSPAPVGSSTDSSGKTVTLITGDVVRVTELDGRQQVADIERPAGATRGVFGETVDGDLYVIPEEAAPLIGANRLDRRLFNVTDLIEQGYDDRARSTIPLIVTYGGQRATPTKPAGAASMRTLRSVNGAAIAADKRAARKFWDSVADPGRLRSGMAKIWLDGTVEASLAESVPQVRAPQAWEAGYDGSGVKVAVLDTGVDATHPDLSDRIAGTRSFIADDPGEVADKDEDGHGTHVTSTVLGSGADSDGTKSGVAPGAKALVGKVLDDEGSGLESWVIEGMQWAAQSGAKVVNMSLSDSTPSDGTDPMSVALDELTRQHGTLFVVAAGNRGAPGTIGSPSAAASALTVASVTKTDARSGFSSQGPLKNNVGLKPDIAAPGSSISAARSQQSPGSGPYVTISGTSMAAPHVAGAAAVLAQRYPGWTPQQLKDGLQSTSKQLADYDLFAIGAGRLDVAAAIGDVHATGSLYFGFFDWPHSGDPVVRKPITYTNAGAEPVTLSLEAPDGFELSAPTVTVPAGGSAQVTVSVAPDGAAIGKHLGQVVAKDGTGTVRAHTGVGFVKEDERYTLTIKVVDRSGKPGEATIGLMREGAQYPDQAYVTGETEFRLPGGRYAVLGWEPVAGEGPDRGGMALLGDPEIVLDRDTEVVLDARKAKLASVQGVPKPVESLQRRLAYVRTFDDGPSLASWYRPTVYADDLYVAPTEKVTNGTLEYATRWRLGAPPLTLRVAGDGAVENTVQYGSARTNGRSSLRAVYAGNGGPADYEGLDAKGKAVIVTRSDAVTPLERVAAAADAGARLLITVNDQPGKLYEIVVPDVDTRTPMPVTGLTKRVGDPLIAKAKSGRLTLDVTTMSNSPYLYDLLDPDHQQIGSDRTYRFDQRKVARVHSAYHWFQPMEGGGYRYDLGPHTPVGVGGLHWQAYPMVRDEWVSVHPGVTWHETNTIRGNDLEERGGQSTYRAGRSTELDWFAPVQRPKMGTGGWGPERRGDQMAWNVAQWSDSGPDHSGFLSIWQNIPGITTTTALYHGDRLLRERNGQDMQWVLPEDLRGKEQFRIVQNASRPAADWRTSTRLRSEWTFWSQHRDSVDDLPALFLDFDIETDLAGDARAGTRDRIGLSAAFKPTALDTGKVNGATLAVSYDDGATWQPVELERERSGGWSGDVKYPTKPGFVSLKASARDDVGNTVEQEVIRAYGLR